MSKVTPEQINRGLSIAEAAIALAADVWKHRKSTKLARRLGTSKAKTPARKAVYRAHLGTSIRPQAAE
jgi:hypothetical protein